ncbi:hypothetical protein GUJ93_ZPchr0004g39412 [Zizania palustris]|uniref:Uncharacterized protein n=1 Tax=Zizania palustris TaxID=103762 RepID=A0A8J5SJ11_ZIZPA|nr:hypothetical protein GUJ93_ZPchr0004g39412 [Zizania palustris]
MTGWFPLVKLYCGEYFGHEMSQDPFMLPRDWDSTVLSDYLVSDDDEMNVDDAGAAIPLGEPKQVDPEEEDPDEIEFYEDGEYEYYPTRLEGA